MEDLQPYLPELRSIAFYYRFLLDRTELSQTQDSLVRLFIAQVYAAQVMVHRYAGN